MSNDHHNENNLPEEEVMDFFSAGKEARHVHGGTRSERENLARGPMRRERSKPDASENRIEPEVVKEMPAEPEAVEETPVEPEVVEETPAEPDTDILRIILLLRKHTQFTLGTLFYLGQPLLTLIIVYVLMLYAAWFSYTEHSHSTYSLFFFFFFFRSRVGSGTSLLE